MSVSLRRLACAIFAAILGCTLGCSKKETKPANQQSASSPASKETGSWHMGLKVSPNHPRMVGPLTFTLHITDERMQPVNIAEVSGALTMKEMDMGTTQLKFAPKGNGDYEASLKGMDMSGAWNLAVDASQSPIHMKKNFEVIVYD